jgi:hypothetical protein
MNATSPDMPGAWDGGSSLSWPHLPEKAPFPTGIGITRRSRFAVATTAMAPIQARNVARTILELILTTSEASTAVSRQVQACVAELVAIAYTRNVGSHLLCELWRDSEHVFTAVQHAEPLPLMPDDTTIGLRVVKALADDYGSHMVDGVFQMWAAVRIA